MGEPGVAVGAGVAVSRIGVSEGGSGLGVALGVTACSVAAAMAWAVSSTWSGEIVAVASGAPEKLQPAISEAASTTGTSQLAVRSMIGRPSSFYPPRSTSTGLRGGGRPEYTASSWYPSHLNGGSPAVYDSLVSTGELVERFHNFPEAELSNGPDPDSGRSQPDPEILKARERVVLARERMLSAALAFCDGTISAGQLRAVRELLREQETRLAQLEGEPAPVFVEDEPGSTPNGDVEMVPSVRLTDGSTVDVISIERES